MDFSATIQNLSESSRPNDEYWMQVALAEAARGEGGTRPNPPVGCVIVRANQLIGKGYHQFAGGPHAEVNAIRSMNGESVEGATLYVTLEPCSTTGRTPPCTEAIIQSGIRRVVVATYDQNPKHVCKGFDVLRDEGIEVVVGVCEADAQAQLAPFFKRITTGRPFVTLKMAQSIDGGIADHAGQSKWITGPAARQNVRTWRQKADVVLVGCGTVLADNPSLLRGEQDTEFKGVAGLRAVLDARGCIPLTAQIFSDGHAEQTLYYTSVQCSIEHREAVERTGARVCVLPIDFIPASGLPVLSLEALLDDLGQLGCMRVLCEGGSQLASSLINAGLVDELLMYIAPLILGNGAKRVFGEYPFDLPTAPRFDIQSVMTIGNDLCVRALPRKG